MPFSEIFDVNGLALTVYKYSSGELQSLQGRQSEVGGIVGCGGAAEGGGEGLDAKKAKDRLVEIEFVKK